MNDNKAFDAYKEDMRHNVEIMSKDEQAVLWSAYKTGNKKAYEKLVMSLLPLVPHIVGNMIRNKRAFGADFNDMVQAGNIGLLQAITSWNPDKGLALSTWAGRYISREVGREGRRDELVTPPVGEVGQYDSLESTGYDTEVDIQDMALIMLGEYDTEPKEISDVETSPDPEDIEIDAQFWETVDKIPEHDAKILKRVYKEGYTIAQLAQESGISRQAASQQHRRALSRVRTRLTQSGYGGTNKDRIL